MTHRIGAAKPYRVCSVFDPQMTQMATDKNDPSIFAALRTIAVGRRDVGRAPDPSAPICVICG